MIIAFPMPLRYLVSMEINQQNVSTAPYPSGWELSSARASSVVRYLVSQFNFPESRLSAVGYSDQKPLYPPSDPRSITLNRRAIYSSRPIQVSRCSFGMIANATR